MKRKMEKELQQHQEVGTKRKRGDWPYLVIFYKHTTILFFSRIKSIDNYCSVWCTNWFEAYQQPNAKG
jgi:hypothetical protein